MGVAFTYGARKTGYEGISKIKGGGGEGAEEREGREEGTWESEGYDRVGRCRLAVSPKPTLLTWDRN